MLTDSDIAEILTVRQDHGQDAAFAALDLRIEERRRQRTSAIDIALEIMVDMLAA